jgi:hypothetical protein
MRRGAIADGGGFVVAEEQKFHALVGKALSDPAFRAQLTGGNKGQQEAALRSVGIEPTDEVMGKLAAATSAVDDLSQHLGGGGVVAS